jgi:hypothetical protein
VGGRSCNRRRREYWQAGGVEVHNYDMETRDGVRGKKCR